MERERTHALVCRQSDCSGEMEKLAQIMQPTTDTSHPLSPQLFLTLNPFLSVIPPAVLHKLYMHGCES